MTPWTKERMLVDAAQWMWFNQKKNSDLIWWTAAALTNHNIDRSNPLLTVEQAETVFRELIDRKLIRADKLGVQVRGNNGEWEAAEMSVYCIQRHKRRQWQKLIKTEGVWAIYVRPTLRYLFGNKMPILFAILAFVFAHFFSSFFEKWGEDLHNFLKPAVKTLIGM